MKVLGAVFFFCVTGAIVNFFVTIFVSLLFGPGSIFDSGPLGSWRGDWRVWPGLILGFAMSLGTALDILHGVSGEHNPRPTKRLSLGGSDDSDGDSDGGSDGGDGGD